MVLTHQKDVEAAKSAGLILTGLLGAALFSLFGVEWFLNKAWWDLNFVATL